MFTDPKRDRLMTEREIDATTDAIPEDDRDISSWEARQELDELDRWVFDNPDLIDVYDEDEDEIDSWWL